MAQVNEVDKTKFSQVMRLPGVLLLSGGLLGAFALSLLSKPIILILYGYEYFPSISLLPIMAWILVPYTINTFLSLAFIINRQESVVVSALIGGILALVILTIWWMRLAGPPGVAWATLSAEIIQSIILLTLDSRHHHVLSAGGLNGFSKFS
jgi:O-antigen/teichoic acid export membrane protein